MMQRPTDREILLAEQRVIQSRREAAGSAARLNTAVREKLARPATLLGVAGAAGVAGYLMFRPRRVRVERVAQASPGTATAATAAVASTSAAGIILAFMMRYALQRLPGIGMRLIERAVRAGAARQNQAASPARYPPASILH